MLAFLIYDIQKARQVISICNVANRQTVSAEIISDHYVGSESYWRNEQELRGDAVVQGDSTPNLLSPDRANRNGEN